VTDLRHSRAGDLGKDEARAIVALTNSIWPHPDKTEEELARVFTDGSRRHWEVFTLWDRARLVAHAAIFPRRIRFEGGELEVMGLAGVCVQPVRRGQGLGERVVRAAFGQVDAGYYPVALYQTEVPAFYARLGAVTVDNPFWNSRSPSDPRARPWWDPHVMIYPTYPAWPRGPIDLNGPGY
jgi:predicted N-acetyltransferase YhbS